jgi:hypothetical protein
MNDKVKIKEEIIKRLEEMPKSKLDKVFRYIESFEEAAKKKNDILSFAGSWKDIAPELLEELTCRLQGRRTKPASVEY